MNGETETMSGSSLDAESRRALDEYHFSLAHQCPGDRPIKIRSYPQSGRLVTIYVCNECYPVLWADAELSEVFK